MSGGALNLSLTHPFSHAGVGPTVEIELRAVDVFTLMQIITFLADLAIVI